MSDALSGFVRVKAKGPFEGQVGVVYMAFTPVSYDDSHAQISYYIRFGNDKPIAFEHNELEQLDTEQATSLLAKEHKG